MQQTVKGNIEKTHKMHK